jgi:leucyl/phenylalanyl-tRNA--protein transferase
LPIHVLHPEDDDFPDPAQADPSGLLAVGGDLRPQRLLTAYARGIFPWYSRGQPILWHSPDPRFVLEPSRFHLPRSLAKALRRGAFEVRYDTVFAEVIRACARVSREGQHGTWITPAMERAYNELHRLGFAHSVESFRDGELCGGLYGVSLGAAFFGESMFARVPDASKVAFAHLVERLRGWGFTLVDCQQETEHLARFGAEPWPRARFLAALESSLRVPTRQGRWSEGD